MLYLKAELPNIILCQMNSTEIQGMEFKDNSNLEFTCVTMNVLATAAAAVIKFALVQIDLLAVCLKYSLFKKL